MIQSASIFLSAFLFIYAVILVVGICEFGSCFVSDIKENLRVFNDEITLSKKLSGREWIEWQTKLNEIMQFHADAKELSIHHMQFVEFTTCKIWLN